MSAHDDRDRRFESACAKLTSFPLMHVDPQLEIYVCPEWDPTAGRIVSREDAHAILRGRGVSRTIDLPAAGHLPVVIVADDGIFSCEFSLTPMGIGGVA